MYCHAARLAPQGACTVQYRDIQVTTSTGMWMCGTQYFVQHPTYRSVPAPCTRVQVATTCIVVLATPVRAPIDSQTKKGWLFSSPSSCGIRLNPDYSHPVLRGLVEVPSIRSLVEEIVRSA